MDLLPESGIANRYRLFINELSVSKTSCGISSELEIHNALNLSDFLSISLAEISTLGDEGEAWVLLASKKYLYCDT